MPASEAGLTYPSRYQQFIAMKHHLPNPQRAAADVFALIIGIDQVCCSLCTRKDGDPSYRQYLAKDDTFGQLSGAVNDAKAFKEFLSKDVGVPAGNIKSLVDGEATRANILFTFESHFLENKEIPDDGTATMIFFFAGHGSRMEMPDNYISEDRMVETICPVDEGPRKAGIVEGILMRLGLVDYPESAKYVHAIPDYVLGQLLKKLASKKGDNLVSRIILSRMIAVHHFDLQTVILDSCHSGGMGRDNQSLGRSRSATRKSSFVPRSVDDRLWQNNSYTPSVWAPHSASHVLLAACSQHGTAYESWRSPAHGYFSEKLIPALRDAVLEIPRKTTYADLIARLPRLHENQTPFCGGANADRLIFKTTTARQALTLTTLARNNCTDEQLFSVSTGSVDGVCPGTIFSVRGPEDKPVCSLVARRVMINRSILAFDGNETEIPRGSCARVKDWKNKDVILCIYIPCDFPYFSDLFWGTGGILQSRYIQVECREAANAALHCEEDKISVEWLSGILQGSDTSFIFPRQALDLPTVVNGIAHFHYFLEHHNRNFLKHHDKTSDPHERVWTLFPHRQRGQHVDFGSDDTGYQPEFDFALEMHRLEGKYPHMKPNLKVGTDGNLVKIIDREDKSKLHGVEIRSKDNINAWYGFTMRNTSSVDLFPYLFYFDPDAYTIAVSTTVNIIPVGHRLNLPLKCWYKPENPRDGPPLRKIDGSVTAGMGSDPPFFLGDPAKPGLTGSGFLKLFVSTESLDLAWIEQTISPLDPDFSGTGRLVGCREEMTQATWNALCILIKITK